MTDGALGPRTAEFLGEELRDNFLSPVEDNFSLLAERIGELGKALDLKRGPRAAQYANSDFRYPGPDDWPALGECSMDRTTAFARTLDGFEGSFRPHSPDLLFNLMPSPLIDAVALAALTMQVNPNAIWDLMSGKFGLLEERCLRQLAALVGWQGDVGGIFTSGGKSTLLYAVKHGLRQTQVDSASAGISGHCRVLVSPYGHYSLESVCNWLGLGRSACRRVAADERGALDPEALEAELRQAFDDGVIVPAIVVSGGSLIDTCVDDVAEVRRVIDRVVRDFALPYVPHLHADTVVTWPWLTVRASDPALAELSEDARRRVLELSAGLRAVSHADSFGVDFHKTGLAAYTSSCYVSRRMSSLRRLELDDEGPDLPLRRQGDRPVYQWSLDNSRSCAGIVMADFVLGRLGRAGLSEYVCRLAAVSDRFRTQLDGPYRSLGTVVNRTSLGLDIVLRVNLGGGSAADVDEQEYESFRDWLAASEYARSRPVPVLGYVPRYKGGKPAFLLLPSSLYADDQTAESALSEIAEAVRRYRDTRSSAVRPGARRTHPEPPR
ncbi:pyridoxal-dependent decarboxylase [Amycolatopsis sp. DG1A-15b]|uniref:pyridoxal-dependent decarboxylase n=1 Tax=Amycolatopsis sp. DG1A-15b TaxID=3052846 RepID=UPI00255BCA76|nr:pyridoxal-dependent decarboxylase [Amycolatopsis sp. DG1A-15b]WIX85826.1 pyridoxal-dependent decarboxylase [Amycolatopsis sp. DG1A-15b]